MNTALPSGWDKLFSEEVHKPYFQELMNGVEAAYQNDTCFPPMHLIWRAFEHCSLDEVRVVIIGQDPYHGPGQANGMSFSVADAVPHPPSLVNIFKEIRQDLKVEPYPSGDLIRWAKQGVLLLNSTLTVRAHAPGSHQKMGWNVFTDSVIKHISDYKSDVLFMLWGGYAKRKGRVIDRTKHVVLESGHPSPLSANRGYWFGNRHFSKANARLAHPINWR